RVLRYLHSFPTRRSSDLKRLGVVRSLQSLQGPDFIALRERQLLPQSLFAVREQRLDRESLTHWPLWVQKLRMQREFGIFLDYLADRKSTRLNSSHRTISY